MYVLEILTIMKIQRMIKKKQTNKGKIQKFEKLIIAPDCTMLGSTCLAHSA